jgi:hypothetical protein
MIASDSFKSLCTFLTLGLDCLTHRYTRRTLALSMAGVDAVVGQMLFDEGGEAFNLGNPPAVRLCPPVSCSQ